ncbi:MAG: hypothetical protein JRC56_05190 [Deltaproteobacteria bacterium]|nr:hypothetical protein [Deltaproteobacteria bacterium]
MRRLTKNQTKFKIIAIFALLAFASTTFASGLSVGKIIPKGKVILFQGNQKVGEFSSEAPFPEGTLLSVQGECGVKLSDLYLVATDKSLFSVTTDPNYRILAVKTGTVYFALSAMPHALVFQTPGGVVTTHQILLDASSEPGLLKGYVSVADGITNVGVFEGGSMLLSIGDGATKKINAGKELRLAQAGLFGDKEKATKGAGNDEAAAKAGTSAAEGAAGASAATGLSTAAIVGISVVVIGLGAVALSGGGGGGSSSTSHH